MSIQRRIVKIVGAKSIRFSIALLSGIIAFQYFQTKVYEFPAPKPFSGQYWYNPYETLNELWLKANFHAHARSWFGLTDGKQSGDVMIKTYRDLGYHIACLSDYHKINASIFTPGNISIPVYEHGSNLVKSHHLGIGAAHVVFNDVCLWQTNSIKQFFIQQVKKHASLVCINHPGLAGGHTIDEISQLTGYECLEVFNNHLQYFPYWDAVLSAGRPVWILGNDDCHDLTKEKFATSWNLINAAVANPTAALEAIRSGRSIAVRRNSIIYDYDSLRAWTRRNKGDILRKVVVDGDRVVYWFNGQAARVKLIGQGGHKLKEASGVDSIAYRFSAQDTYVRAEIETPAFTAYLNPLIRYDGTSAPSNVMLAKVRSFPTWTMRLSVMILYTLLIGILFPHLVHRIRNFSKRVLTIHEHTKV